MWANLVLFFHQESDPEEWKTKQQHESENDPATGADVTHVKGRLIGSTIRASVLRRLITHAADL